MTKETNTKLQEFKDAVIEKAEKLILKTVPETILGLNVLMETPIFKKQNLNEIYEDLNIPVTASTLVKNESESSDESSSQSSINDVEKEATNPSNSKISCNGSICKIIDTMKPKVCELLEDCNLLKMWISYMIPKIEDGNNFGVSVQENTLAEIEITERWAADVFTYFSGYFNGRGKLISKVIKYPNIEDYRRTIAEYDEEQYVYFCRILREIRNRYSALHDKIIKNVDKLKKPRTSNIECLY